MRAHYFQHVPFEGLGVIEPWLQAAGYQISRTCFYQPHELPRLAALDLLIVLGGPMSVNDEDSSPQKRRSSGKPSQRTNQYWEFAWGPNSSPMPAIAA